MHILTKRNGIALVAVLAILLVLTLLLPVMFSMSERATVAAMEGTDKERSSYLARTMIEMSVSAFQEIYGAAEDYDEFQKPSDKTSSDIIKAFIGEKGADPVAPQITCDTLYMYSLENAKIPKKPDEGAEQALKDKYEKEVKEYEESAVQYSTEGPGPDNKKVINGKTYIFIGKADCTLDYKRDVKYYKTIENGESMAVSEADYKRNWSEVESALYKGGATSEEAKKSQYFKVDSKQVTFNSEAIVNDKKEKRRCILVLPTKPSESNWLVATSTDGHQIYPDTDFATGIKALEYNADFGVDGKALKQPFYIFSCLGNMVIGTKDLKLKTTTDASTNPVYKDYDYPNGTEYLSLGLHPSVNTVKPENDPNFSCLKTANMRKWADDARKDNFVGFAATNAIQVDLPIKLLVTPARTGRIGDGLASNQSLYKIMFFQAPTIVFNKGVDSMISLYCKRGPLFPVHNAYRMTSVILGAPSDTPFSYENSNKRYNRTVKAGKVIFTEDAYLWVIPFAENGSNYKFQTVYYKGKDISIYKFANAGDMFYFNNEVEAEVDGKMQRIGFSLTGYFMDVLYSQREVNTTNWWEPWEAIQNGIFNGLLKVNNKFSKDDNIYVPEDLKWIGNIYSGVGGTMPLTDDCYVVWES